MLQELLKDLGVALKGKKVPALRCWHFNVSAVLMEEFYSEYINHCAMQNCSLPAQTCVSEKGIVEPFLGVRWVWQGRKPHCLRGFLHADLAPAPNLLPSAQSWCSRDVGLGGEPEQSLRVSCFLPWTCINRVLTHMSSSAGTSQSGSLFSIREIVRLMKFPGVMEVFIVKVFAGLPIGKSITHDCLCI